MTPPLIFCTSHAFDQSVWQSRYHPWLAGIRAGFPGAHVLIVDDGSAVLPAWPELHVASGDVLGEAFTAQPRPPALLFHFRQRLGRRATLDFPGWHRSFCFAALYAEAHGYERVIHVESDAAVISERARAYLLTAEDCWAAFWCREYDMPESAIQVASGSGLRAMAAFARRPYDALIGRTHEREMPFTELAKDFTGGRVGEWIDAIAEDADFAAQIPGQREAGFGWFRAPGARPSAPPARTIRRGFTQGGDGVELLGDGWSAPEPAHCWMTGAESSLVLPGLPGGGEARLRLRVTPHVWRDALRSQRLIVECNGVRVREFLVTLEALLGCTIPERVLGRAGGDVLRLIHPDAAAPADLSPEMQDGRRLALSLEWLELSR